MSWKKSLAKFYKKIKLVIYKNMFSKIKDGEDALTSSEYLCLECIFLMDKPTITEFAEFLDISAPNATYKIKQLIKKGFISKEKSEKDKREFLLVPTQKFFDLYQQKEDGTVVNDVKNNLDKKETKRFDKILKILEGSSEKDGI
ncbi:MAG: MarR family transcriptional regulator [Clostridia bacterium]|nr:MarR family transcriptional regulator [Clostridia bacterium]